MTHDLRSGKGRGRSRVWLAALLACAALATVPAAANAAVVTLGSDLSKPADLIDAHGADSVWWNVFIGNAPQAIPVGGQVTFVRVKGSVVDDPDKPRRPDPQFHFNVLRPQGAGAVKVMLSSAPFRLPITYPQSSSGAPAKGDPQQINGFKPVNMCVSKGDYFAFNDFGGFEWRWGPYPGMAVQVFSRVPDTIANFYTKNGGITNGVTFSPQDTKQQEVLMQYHLATGPDATDLCPGGYKQHIFQGFKPRADSISISAKKRVMKLHGACPYVNYGECKGVLVVKATLGGAPTTLGGTPFSVNHGSTASFEINLSRKIVKKIKKAGVVKAIVSADAHDDPAHDRRASDGVPVQRKSTSGTVKVRVG